MFNENIQLWIPRMKVLLKFEKKRPLQRIRKLCGREDIQNSQFEGWENWAKEEIQEGNRNME